MEQRLWDIIRQIAPLDEAAVKAAERRQAELAKPPGSLGKLEDIAIRLAGITGKVCSRIEKTRIIVLCADNGVAEEGVASAPQSVTAAQAVNMTRRLTGMSALAKHFGDDVMVVDMGIACPYHCPDILDRSLGKGTANLHREPAMSREQAVKAILTGIELAETAKKDGIQAVGVGEMGIGNTTTTSAVLAALTGVEAEKVTGRGGGINDESFLKKKRTIQEALELHRPDRNDVIDVLRKVGGFDIAAMCGVFLGAARYRIPVVIDGFISIVAALCAARLCERAKDYFFPSHASYEIGFMLAAEELKLEPWLLMGMRLGEGSGCPLAFRIMDAACCIMNDMATFAEASIDDGYLDEIRAKDSFTV